MSFIRQYIVTIEHSDMKNTFESDCIDTDSRLKWDNQLTHDKVMEDDIYVDEKVCNQDGQELPIMLPLEYSNTEEFTW